MKVVFKTFLLISSLSLIVGCSFLRNTDPIIIELPRSPEPPPVAVQKVTEPKPPESQSEQTIAAADLSYTKVNETVFKAKCLQCHSGKYEPNLSTYAAVLINKEKIFEQSILSAKMPKAPLQLTDVERWNLKTWLDSGAPEFATDGEKVQNAPATPLVSKIERPVKWDTINATIIQKSCLGRKSTKSCEFWNVNAFRGGIRWFCADGYPV